MTIHDLYLLSPELSLAGLAVMLIVVDLFVRNKVFISLLAVLGLLLPLSFTIALWIGLDRDAVDPALGIFDTLIVDKFSLFFKFLFLGVVGLVILSSVEYVKKFERFQAEYYSLILFSTSGMMLLASTMELISIYIALELTALPLAALASFMKDARSSESGMKFLILSAISSAVLLYGMVLIYGFTGTTKLEEVAMRLSDLAVREDVPFGSYAVLLGVLLMIAGFGFKITMVPFQMWAPDVYEGSPTPITAFLSVASKAAGFAVILRVFYMAFPLDVISIEWSAIFAILSAASMTIGNLVAIPQRNIKRMLAYSTIAHAGYILVGVAAAASRVSEGGESVGATGVLFYLGGYAATNIAAFAVVIAISDRIGSDRIEDYRGMARRAPYLAGILAFAMVSLIGVPPTVGFMAKINIFGSAVNADLTWLAVIGTVNSVISAYYYLRVVRIMYFSSPVNEERVTVGAQLRLAMILPAAAVLFFGLYPEPMLNMAQISADVLVASSVTEAVTVAVP